MHSEQVNCNDDCHSQSRESGNSPKPKCVETITVNFAALAKTLLQKCQIKPALLSSCWTKQSCSKICLFWTKSSQPPSLTRKNSGSQSSRRTFHWRESGLVRSVSNSISIRYRPVDLGTKSSHSRPIGPHPTRMLRIRTYKVIDCAKATPSRRSNWLSAKVDYWTSFSSLSRCWELTTHQVPTSRSATGRE